MKKHKLDILIENEVNGLTQDQIGSLNKCGYNSWKLIDDKVDFYGDFWLEDKSLTQIPITFNYVEGTFDCRNCQLISLKGCPSVIGGNFNCYGNQLTSLEYAPTKIHGTIWCDDNPFILNDKLFEYFAIIGGKQKIRDYTRTLKELKEKIRTQFGVRDQNIVEDIWQSYMNILEGKINE